MLPKFEPEIPSMPFESIATDYFDFEGRHYLVIVDRLSGWIEVMRAPVGSVQSGAKGLCEWFRQYMARFGVPVVVSSDGGPEYIVVSLFCSEQWESRGFGEGYEETYS